MDAVLDLRPIVPAAIVAVTGLVVLLAQAFSPKGKASPSSALSLAGLAAALGSVWLLATGPGRGSVLAGAVAADDFSLFFHALILGVAAVTVLLSAPYLRRTGWSGASTTPCCSSPWSACWGSSPASSSCRCSWPSRSCRSRSTRMAGMNRARPESQESALKYFVTGAFASAFFLYGIALLYGVSGSTSLDRVARAVALLSPGAVPLAVLGAALLLVGFGFKVASVPFHMWAPDVYEGAPTTVTAFMSAGVKAAAFGALLRVFDSALPALASHWQPLVAVLAIVTMVVGNLAALAQTNLKRMLAYSSIAHAGYLLAALVAAPVLAGEAVLFYLVAYAAVNLGAFGAIAALSRDGREPLALAGPGGPRRPAAGARRRAHRLPRLAHRHPGHRRLRGQVLPLQRRGRRGLGGAGPRRRAHERRVGLLLPAGGGGDVHARPGRRGRLVAGLPGRGVRARVLGRGHAAARRLAGAAAHARPPRRPQPAAHR